MEAVLEFFSLATASPNAALLLALGYLSGAVPYGYLIAKLFLGFDIRTQGSGNIGMTNMIRTGGKGPGAATFLLDFAKGSLPVVLALVVFKTGLENAILVGLLSVFGHTRSIFLGFGGGKGVATNLGIWLALDWRVFLCLALTWAGVFLARRISSLAALSSLAITPVFALVLLGPVSLAWGALASCSYIFLLHHENIRRLLQGQEGKLKSGS